MIESLTSYLELAKRCNDATIDAFRPYLRSLVGVEVGESVWVPLVMLTKVCRCHEAARLLVENNLSSEAGGIAVTQFEVRLDLMYLELSDSLGRNLAREWVEHTNEKREPWTATVKINAIYKEKVARDAQFLVYRKLSQAKHANPVGGRLAIPIAKDGTNWTISGMFDDAKEVLSGKQMLIISCLHLLQSAASAARLLSKQRSVPSDFYASIETLYQEVKSAYACMVEDVQTVNQKARAAFNTL